MEGLFCFASVFLLVGIANAAGTSGTSATCCEALAKQPQLRGKVYYPGTNAYDERLETYWSLSAALSPWCMVLPETPNQASIVIRTIAKNECPFGIRGGGHGAHALSNSLEKGVTIDMGYFNTTTYNKKAKIASVGPGAHWGAVYDTLTPHGVTVTGGRASSVGVGGFLTGGGNSFHSASHGYACDQVQNFEVVLANGQIVNASEKENPDLWKSLKGGSGNFGLVTRYDVHVIEFENPAKPYIWSGVVNYNYTKTEPLIKAFVNFTNNVVNDVYSSMILDWNYRPSAGGFFVRTIPANVANKAYPPAFDEFLAIDGKISNSLRSSTMSNLTGGLVEARTRTIWFTGTYKNDARVLQFIAKHHEKMMLSIEKVIGAESGMFSSCQTQPVTKPMVTQGKGKNVMGLEERVKKGPGFVFLIYFGVKSSIDERTAFPYVEQFYKDVEEYATSLNANWNWHYLNYAHSGQDPIHGYGKEPVKVLRAASQMYDPKGVFQHLRHSGFKIPG